MRKFSIILLGLCMAASLCRADEGVRLIFKAGVVDNYSQGGLDLPVYDVENLNLIGGQFKLSRLPAVDLIVGADYSWRDREYIIDNQELSFRVRDLAVTASVVYPVRLSPAEIYLGGGVGSHSVSYEYRHPPTLTLEDHGIDIPETSSYFGYHALIGGEAGLPLIPVGLFMELRCYRVDAPENDISYTSWAVGLSIPLE